MASSETGYHNQQAEALGYWPERYRSRADGSFYIPIEDAVLLHRLNLGLFQRMADAGYSHGVVAVEFQNGLPVGYIVRGDARLQRSGHPSWNWGSGSTLQQALRGTRFSCNGQVIPAVVDVAVPVFVLAGSPENVMWRIARVPSGGKMLQLVVMAPPFTGETSLEGLFKANVHRMTNTPGGFNNPLGISPEVYHAKVSGIAANIEFGGAFPCNRRVVVTNDMVATRKSPSQAWAPGIRLEVGGDFYNGTMSYMARKSSFMDPANEKKRHAENLTMIELVPAGSSLRDPLPNPARRNFINVHPQVAGSSIAALANTGAAVLNNQMLAVYHAGLQNQNTRWDQAMYRAGQRLAACDQEAAAREMVIMGLDPTVEKLPWYARWSLKAMAALAQSSDAGVLY
jgi:hypothetical protein